MKILILKIRQYITLLTVIIISGCSVSMPTEFTMEPPQRIMITNTSTIEPTLLPVQPTQTGAIPTATILPSPTPTATSAPEIEIRLRDQCAILDSNETTPLEGVIALTTMGDDELQLLNLSNGKTIQLGQLRRYGSRVAVSPDFKSIAFIDINTHQLKISDALGYLQKAISVPTDWEVVIEWIKDDVLLIERTRYLEGTQVYDVAATILFDLASEDYKEYLLEYPGRILSHPGIEWEKYRFTQAAYSPNFNYVIYPASFENDAPLILWDLLNSREIIRIHGFLVDFGGEPAWLKDSRSAIIGAIPEFEWDGNIYANDPAHLPYLGGFDIFKVKVNGELERLTYLTTKYKAAAEGRALSPDENRIAFWMNLDYEQRGDKPEIKHQLSILDTDTGEISNLCIEEPNWPPRSPVWSPDGQKLLVTIYQQISPKVTSNANVFLVDIENRIVTPIAKQSEAVGWLIKP